MPEGSATVVEEAESSLRPGFKPTRVDPWLVATLAWLIAFAAALVPTLSSPLLEKFDFNNAIWAIAARNLVRDGCFELRGGVYVSPGDYPRDQRHFYPGHPPLLAWTTALWMRCFGQSDAALRALPLAITLAILLLTFLLVRIAFPGPAAFAAAALLSLFPFTAYYARLNDTEQLTTLFMLAASLAYLRYCRSGSKRALAALLLCVILGCWVDWPMYLYTGLLAIAHLARTRLRTSRDMLVAGALLALPTVMFVVFALYLRLNGEGLDNLLIRARVRAGAIPAANETREGRPYLILLETILNPIRFHRWFGTLVTPPAALLAGAALMLWRWWAPHLEDLARQTPRPDADLAWVDTSPVSLRAELLAVTLCLFGAQALYVLVFPDGAIRHEFYQYYWGPPTAILAGSFVAWAVLCQSSRRPWLTVAAVALAAAIPVCAFRPGGPFSQRMGWSHDALAYHDPAFYRVDYAPQLRAITAPRDLVIMDYPPLGYCLPWYADRLIICDELIPLGRPRNVDDLRAIMADYPGATRRTLLLCNARDAQPHTPPSFYQQVAKMYGSPYQVGHLQFFLITGEPDPAWQRVALIAPAQAELAAGD